MMKRFFRWQRWRWSSRYWKRRAHKAEALLLAETQRNRAREDTLVTIPVRMAGLMAFGLEPRDAPARMVHHAPRQLTAVLDPWDALSGAERMEFDTFWKADAEAAGISLQQARRQFMAEIEKRKSLNDEPSM